MHSKSSLVYTVAMACIVATMLHFVHVIHVQGVSMVPTLRDDTYAIGIRAFSISRNDIVIAQSESFGLVIKRVIGIGGDHVIMAEDGTYVNGNKIEDPFGVATPVDIYVPEGELFLVGDNRVESVDSRIFGTIPTDVVKYKLFTIKTVNYTTYRVLRFVVTFILLLLIFCDYIITIRYREKEKNVWEEQEVAQVATADHQAAEDQSADLPVDTE